jgi:hypothetical protein
MQPIELDAFTNHVRALEQEVERLNRELLAAKAELALDHMHFLEMRLATSHLEFLQHPEIVWDCLRRRAAEALEELLRKAKEDHGK